MWWRAHRGRKKEEGRRGGGCRARQRSQAAGSHKRGHKDEQAWNFQHARSKHKQRRSTNSTQCRGLMCKDACREHATVPVGALLCRRTTPPTPNRHLPSTLAPPPPLLVHHQPPTSNSPHKLVFVGGDDPATRHIKNRKQKKTELLLKE